jgi:hypothetical protein
MFSREGVLCVRGGATHIRDCQLRPVVNCGSDCKLCSGAPFGSS